MHETNQSRANDHPVSLVPTTQSTKQTDSPPEKVQLIILAYLRAGSSFFGDMFQLNPEAFYMFEPLDSYYSAHYGTTDGWNVGTDIFSYPNGSVRTMPAQDKEDIPQFLYNLLTCNVQFLPTAFLMHGFYKTMDIQYTHIADYRNCISNIQPCDRTKVTSYCGYRYGLHPEKTMASCRKLLSGEDDESVPGNVRKDFKNYNRCMERKKQMIHKVCLKYLQGTCESKEIAVTKLVRASMATMETLLESMPNLKIIHLIRDPRGVALSRFTLMNASLKGMYSIAAGENKTETCKREAALYCHKVVEDIKVRVELEKRFPGRIINVISDEYVRNVSAFINKIYRFVGKPLTEESFDKLFRTLRPSVMDRLNANLFKMSTNNTSDYEKKKLSESLTVVRKWKANLDLQTQNVIMNECRQLYDTVKFD